MNPGTRGDYQTRTMTRTEIDSAIEWAGAEGWNPGLDDAACFRAADPGGFLAGLLDDELVATISVVKYGDSFGFLGLYIVKPAFRGRGYGIRLWDAGLAYLGQRTVGLDGVIAQQDNYRKSGFALAYRNIRYQRMGGTSFAGDRRVVPLVSIPFDDVNAYDRSVFVADRATFLDRNRNRNAPVSTIKRPHCADPIGRPAVDDQRKISGILDDDAAEYLVTKPS